MSDAWSESNARSRALSVALEPVAGSVYFADRGLLDGDVMSSQGSDARQALEADTDRLCSPMVHALGDDVIELIGRLQPWGAAVRSANGYYPSSPQEAVLDDRVQEWMQRQGLAPFTGASS